MGESHPHPRPERTEPMHSLDHGTFSGPAMFLDFWKEAESACVGGYYGGGLWEALVVEHIDSSVMFVASGINRVSSGQTVPSNEFKWLCVQLCWFLSHIKD